MYTVYCVVLITLNTVRLTTSYSNFFLTMFHSTYFSQHLSHKIFLKMPFSYLLSHNVFLTMFSHNTILTTMSELIPIYMYKRLFSSFSQRLTHVVFLTMSFSQHDSHNVFLKPLPLHIRPHNIVLTTSQYALNGSVLFKNPRISQICPSSEPVISTLVYLSNLNFNVAHL